MRRSVDFLKNRRRLRRQVQVVEASPLFDAAYYRQRYGLGGSVNAAVDFCRRGWREGRNPSDFFDVAFYLDTYGDVREAGVNPLVHYLTGGAQELRRPSPDFDVNAFCRAHDEFDFRVRNAAELCLATYGTYEWRDAPYAGIELPDDVIAAFRPAFDAAFYQSMNADVLGSDEDPYDHFIRRGQHQDRDPAPGFDIHFYRRRIADRTDLAANPIFHYARHGRQQGVPTQAADTALIDPLAPGPSRGLRVCAHAHCFYPELLGELIPGLANLPASAAAVVTVVTAADREFVRKRLAREGLPQRVEVRLVPNRGRDLGPFLVGCRDVWRDFDLVLHVHTKSSGHVAWGTQWRHYLLDQTMGSKALVAAIVARFEAEADLGCLYPRNFCRIRRYTHNEVNRPAIEALMARLGHGPEAAQQPDYPAGAMAWYRADALAALADALEGPEEFEPEAAQLDGTLAHAMERVMPLAARAAGFRVRAYATPRRARLAPLPDFPVREASMAPVPARWRRDTPRIARHAPVPVAPLARAYDPAGLNIHWIVPSFVQGGGGHMTIFRLVEFLDRFGHHQTLWLQNATQFADQAEAKRCIQRWYRPIGERVHVRFLPEDVRQIAGDALIATDCWTAYPAALVRNVKERFYLIQDYEPSFHPTGELQLAAEATYGFGFATLCAGSWLHGLMRSRGLWSRSWDLCADHEVYFPGLRRAGGDRPPRIAFYARLNTPRRAVPLGLAAFEILHRRGVAFHVEMFGEADLEIEAGFPHTRHGILTPAELSELYRACDVGVVFSTTNYSLSSLEMMACGLPVVEIDMPSTRAVFADDAVTFAPGTPYGVADAIERLLADPGRQDRQRERGYALVEATSWERSARSVEGALRERLDGLGYRAVEPWAPPLPGRLTRPSATVLIPTRDAGPGFARVLNRVTRQVCDFPYDVLVLDSGSRDDTCEIAARHDRGRVRIERVPGDEFQHGRTRNLGIGLSEGSHVAMLTQDACPKDERWLAALVGGFARGPRVAGVIGRHEAYPEHDAFTRRDIAEIFDGLALLPDVVDREIGLPSYIYPGGQRWRSLLHFYSDNNSALARTFWEMLPYPEIDWGEDQAWADEAIRLGLQKAYVNEAVVFHSHGLDLKAGYARAATEGRFWGERFGLDLHPDPKAAVAAMDARDQTFAVRAGIGPAILRQRLLINRAVVEGRSDGYRSVSGFLR